MVELIGGQVDLHVDQVMSALSHIRSGKVRALAVTTRKQRAAQLPEVPTFHESGVANFEAMGFTGLVAPAGTPREIVAKLNAAMHKALGLPAVRDYITGLGSDVVPGTPEELGQYIKEDLARWTEVVKKGGMNHPAASSGVSSRSLADTLAASGGELDPKRLNCALQTMKKMNVNFHALPTMIG